MIGRVSCDPGSGATGHRGGGAQRPGIPLLRLAEHRGTGMGLGVPAAIALAEWLGRSGLAPHFVLPVPAETAPLLSAFAPVHRAADPGEGEALAMAAGAGSVVFAGTFRRSAGDPPSAVALTVARAGGAAGGGAAPGVQLRLAWPGGKAVLDGRLAALATGMDWRDLPVLAFAGTACGLLGTALEAEGARLLRLVRVDDAGALPPRLCARLAAEARARGAQLVTAEADTVRLPAKLRSRVLAMPLRLRIGDWTPLAEAAGVAAGDGG